MDLMAAPAAGAFFFDDQAAIKGGARHDGFAIVGQPVTPGFDAIRQPAEAVSVMLRLSDGHVAHGDCVAVQYSGVGGRDPVMRSAQLVPLLEGEVADSLRGRPVESFRELSQRVDELVDDLPGFGTAAAYGLSQALLAAVAHARGETMARTIQHEWQLDGRAGAGTRLRAVRRAALRERRQDDPARGRLAAPRADQQPGAGRS